MKSDAPAGLLQALRARIKDGEALAACNVLVLYGERSSVYTTVPGGHGYIKDIRYEVGGARPFAFTCNKAHLLFYVRPAGVRELGATVRKLSKWFGEVNALRGGKELTVRIRTLADARKVIAHLMEPWAIGKSQGGIPKGITRADVLQAVAEILAGRAGDHFGESVNWDVVVDGELYPPQRVLGVAARRVAGRELVSTDFQGDDSRCHPILTELGFEIVPKGDLRAAREVLEEQIAHGIRQRTDMGPTQKQMLITARRGQGAYRTNLEQFEQGCRVTGVLDRRHLRASHIKPWKDSSDLEKLDGQNGLLLAPHVEHLFNQGYLSFSDDGKLLVSQQLNKVVLKRWGIEIAMQAGTFTVGQKVYLAWHREHVFEKAKAGRRR